MKMISQRLFVLLLASLLAVPAVSLAAKNKRMIMLGIDGMDPVMLQKYMDQGVMPNMKRLASDGGFMAIGTSQPPQSPVAWSNLITGMNPGGHGLYDFLSLDRETMLPYMSSVRVVKTLDWGTIGIGSWQLPLVVEEPVLLRHGKAFWEILEEAGVRTRIFRMPSNYPPVETISGKSLSGMGTPDLRGSSGTFSFYTDDPLFPQGSLAGGEVTRVVMRSGVTRSKLLGPANPYREDTPATEVEFELTYSASTGIADIEIGDESVELAVGGWSDWVSVNFELIPVVASLNGMVRFYLQQAEPNLRLYVSPVNIDPRAPAQVIAAPPEYAFELAESAGPFYTQEMPEDTKALSANILTAREFLDQSGLVLDERRRLLAHELKMFGQESTDAFMFFYVSSLDQRNHMLARQMDPDHPYHEADTPPDLVNAMQTTYQEIDEMVGFVREQMTDDMDLIVMSDHGFASFRTQVNLNTWLEREGYLKLKNGGLRDQYEWLEGIDWSQTRAFAIGLNSLYINVKGRERDGIVAPADRAALAREIVAKLAQWKDSATDAHVVTQPAIREDIYAGPHVESAPDVLVGYAEGYRASWATTSGEIPAELLEPNLHEWSGDHCMDSTAVPGVLLSTRPLRLKNPDLRDLTATILTYYNVALPAQVEGNSVF